MTSTTHQGRADGDFADTGGNLLATVSYPDGNPTVNVVQFARDAISPFVSVGYAADIMLPGHMPDAYEATITSIHDFAASL